MIISRGITIIRIVTHGKKKSNIPGNCPEVFVDICLQEHIMLNMRIKELIEEASFLNADDFSALIGEADVILKKEREEGKTEGRFPGIFDFFLLCVTIIIIVTPQDMIV